MSNKNNNGTVNIEYMIVPEKYKFVEFMPIGDIHYGSPECAEDFLKICLDWCLKEQNRFVIGMGDFIEAAVERKKGLHHQTMSLDKQVRDIIKLFKPLADRRKLIGIHRGNHEMRMDNAVNYNVTKDIAERLNVKYFGDAMAHLLYVGNPESESICYSAYTVHGASGARYFRTKMYACEKLNEIVKNCDMYIMAHTHALGHMSVVSYELDKNYRIKSYSPTQFILSGAFLNYEKSYAEARALPPTGKIGAPKIKLHIDYNRISVSL